MSCLLQAKLSACRREYLYPLSSRSSFPRPLYVARELLREEHCSTIWFAGGDLAGLFCFVQRWGRKRETVSLFLMLQEGEQDHGRSWHEFVGPGVVRRERRGGKGRKGGREGEALCQAFAVQNPWDCWLQDVRTEPTARQSFEWDIEVWPCKRFLQIYWSLAERSRNNTELHLMGEKKNKQTWAAFFLSMKKIHSLL